MEDVTRTRGRGARRHVALVYVLVALAWFTVCHRASGADPQFIEDRVKAAYLYRFAEYIEWPEGIFARRDTPLTIGVLGSESFAYELTVAVTGRTINGRLITVKHLEPGEPIPRVHVLFIGRSESGRINRIAQAAQARSILIVTEADDALAQGSVINFVLVDRRVRFEVSLESAERTRLRLSSRLLDIAQQVRPASPRLNRLYRVITAHYVTQQRPHPPWIARSAE